MRTKICALLLAGLALLSLAGCDATDSTTPQSTQTRFRTIETDYVAGGTNRILVDTETGVMYLFHSEGYAGGLTVMVDTEGKPLIWAEKGEGEP